MTESLQKEKRKNCKTNLREGVMRDSHYLIRDIARRAGFTQGDVKIILEALKESLAEIIGRREILHFGGLFTMYLSEKKATTFKFIKDGKEVSRLIPQSYFASFKGSKQLLRYLPEKMAEKSEETIE
jgi:nucleoid DNA-binding protein